MSNFICVVCGNPFTGNKYMKKDAKVVCCSKECKRERKRYTDQLRHFSRTHPNVTKSDIEAEYTKFLLEKLLIKKMKGHAKYLKLLKYIPISRKNNPFIKKNDIMRLTHLLNLDTANIIPIQTSVGTKKKK